MSRVFGVPKWDESRNEWRLGVRDKGRRTTVTSKIKSARRGPAECLQKAAAWVGDHDAPENIRFWDAWEEFLKFYEQKNKITSLKQLEARGKAHLVPRFRASKLQDISKRQWQAAIDDAYKDGAKSAATLKGISTTIVTFCKWAASRGYLRDTDVPIYFAYPVTATTKPKRILQPDQLRLLFSADADDGNFYLYVFRFLAVTGLRRGEVCALQYGRDFDGQSITIRESISHDQDVTDGKTHNANRCIRLTPIAIEQINHHRALAPSSFYLFGDSDGHRINPRVLRNHWQLWREAHGIDLTLHELRHTYISYSRLKSSADLDALKQLYGHSAAMPTDKVYVHDILRTPEEIRAEEEKDEKIANDINRVFLAIVKNASDTQ